MSPREPIPDAPRGIGLRQRQRAGTWRVWWEPTATERKAGAEPVELDPGRPTWSIREARRLKAEARAGGKAKRAADSGGRTVSALVNAYMASPRWKKLKPATQDGYRADFRVIEDKWGAYPVRSFDRPVVYAWYETRYAKAPTYAGKVIRALSVLMSHAELLGWRPENSNPCFRLGVEAPKRRKRHATWAEFDALLASAEVLGYDAMRCAIAMAVLAAQRPADIIAARVGEFGSVPIDTDAGRRDVWIWNLTRSKRGNTGSIPLHPLLVDLVVPLLEGRDPEDRLLLDAGGAPFTRNTFSNRWEDIRRRAAQGPSADELHAHYRGDAPLPDAALHPVPALLDPVLQFRDLRRTFGVWSRHGGALREDVGDVLGNSAATDPALGEVYMPAQLVTAARAVAAIRRPAEEEERKKA